jgi:hypothetical protein
VTVAGCVSLAVLAFVGRRSYKRKVVQLTKELEKEGKKGTPDKVWAVLTPQETIKVFLVPLTYILSGTALTAFFLKRCYGIHNLQQGIDTLKWIARTGPPPTS